MSSTLTQPSSTNHNTKHNNTNTLTSWPWLWLPLRRPQCLLPSIDKQVTQHQHEDHRSVIPYCVSPTWAPMVMAAIRIKILHCAIAIACCRCRSCNHSIVIAAPPSPPPLSQVVLSSSLPILFKYCHRSQRGRCTEGGGWWVRGQQQGTKWRSILLFNSPKN